MSAAERLDALTPSALPLPASASPAVRCRDAAGKPYARHRWSKPGNVREDTGRRYCLRCSADEPGKTAPKPEPWAEPLAAPEPPADPAPFGWARTGRVETPISDDDARENMRIARHGISRLAREAALEALQAGGVLPRLARDTSPRIEETRAPMRLPTAEPRPSGPDGDAAMEVAADTGGCATGTADQGATTGPTAEAVTSHAAPGGLMTLSGGTGQDRDAAPLPNTEPHGEATYSDGDRHGRVRNPQPPEAQAQKSSPCGATSTAPATHATGADDTPAGTVPERAGATHLSPPAGGGATSPTPSLSSPPPAGPQTVETEATRNVRYRAAFLAFLDGIERAVVAARELIEAR